MPRMALVMAAAIALGVAFGLASDSIVAQMFTPHPWASLYGYDSRGAILAARVPLLAAASLFAGALFGRQLPALVVGACLTFGIGVLITGEDAVLNRANKVLLADQDTAFLDNLSLDGHLQEIATGRILTSDEEQTVDYGSDQFQTLYRSVSFGIPASQAGEVVWRDVGFYLLPTLAFLGLTFIVVERRRPYLS
jgi:hypothetical protein